jgi:hypothetical protein
VQVRIDLRLSRLLAAYKAKWNSGFYTVQADNKTVDAAVAMQAVFRGFKARKKVRPDSLEYVELKVRPATDARATRTQAAHA